MFHDKVNKDFNLNVLATVYYEKRCIKSVKFNSSIFFKTTYVVTEYANFIPRFIAIITFSKIHSILYGFLNKKILLKSPLGLDFLTYYFTDFTAINFLWLTEEVLSKHFNHFLNLNN